MRSRRRGAVCDKGEEGESDEHRTAGLPRCECTREEVEVVTVMESSGVYDVGRGGMCGDERWTTRPATQLSRRHSRDGISLKVAVWVKIH